MSANQERELILRYRREADALIEAANAKAKARLDAAGVKRAKANDNAKTRRRTLAEHEHGLIAAIRTSDAILRAAGEEQLLGPRFAGKTEK